MQCETTVQMRDRMSKLEQDLSIHEWAQLMHKIQLCYGPLNQGYHLLLKLQQKRDPQNAFQICLREYLSDLEINVWIGKLPETYSHFGLV